MSARRNRFLASTCLGILGFSFIVGTTPAFAGFEWTPPEKQVVAPLPKPPQAHDFSHDESALPEVEDVEVLEESPQPSPQNSAPAYTDGRLKVKVITPREEVETLQKGQMVEEEPSEPVVMSAPVIPVAETPDSVPEPFPITETHQGTDTVINPAESVSAPAKETPVGLNINPYPLEEADHTAPALEEAPAPEPEVIAWKGGAFDVVEGFGSDMPLALALRQVVPAEYAFSFGRGVNPGHLVSWEGGKPWNLVLGDMLRPLNIKALIEGNVVKVVSTAPMAPAAPEPEPVPAAGESSEVTPAPEAAPAAPEVEPVKKVEASSPKEPEEPAKELAAVEEKADQAEEPEAEKPLEVASAPKAAPEPEVKKAPGRNVILDPGDVKPAASSDADDEAEKAEKSDDADVEAVVLAEEESAPPSEEVLKTAKAEEAEKPAPTRSNEQMFQPRIWEAKQGSSLKETLDSWSKQANVPLQWNADKDFTLSSNILISGTFDNAVKVLFAQAVKNGPVHNLTTGPEAALVIGEAAKG